MTTTRDLPAGATRALSRLQADLQEIFGARLESLMLYGPHVHGVTSTVAASPAGQTSAGPLHTLALVSSLEYADLAACSGRVAGWHRAGLATPLLLASDEFAASLDAFPLEYGAIIAHHHVVSGSDPFVGISVDAEDVRRACEVQAKSHLLHLREGFLETSGDGEAVARLIHGSIGSFTTLLLNLASLDRTEVTTTEALARYAETRIGVSASLVSRLLALPARAAQTQTALGRDEAAQIYPPYLEASETLARFVDRWKERGRA